LALDLDGYVDFLYERLLPRDTVDCVNLSQRGHTREGFWKHYSSGTLDLHCSTRSSSYCRNDRTVRALWYHLHNPVPFLEVL